MARPRSIRPTETPTTGNPCTKLVVPVQGIDRPEPLGPPAALLFGEDRDVSRFCAEDLDDGGLARPVDVGHVVAGCPLRLGPARTGTLDHRGSRASGRLVVGQQWGPPTPLLRPKPA